MSVEENKALVRGRIEAYNRRELDCDRFVSDDYVDHTNGVDKDGLKAMFAMGLGAFPDWRETVEDMVGEGDRVWVALSYEGTNTGEFMGLPPTGNRIVSKAVDMYRVKDGKLVEYWNVTDNAPIYIGVGAVEFTEKGKRLMPKDAK